MSIVLKKTGLIFSVYCDCKAGSSGLCAHVGALLYTLVKTKQSCISHECQWDRPKPIQRKPSPKRVSDIKFVKTDKEQRVEKVKPCPVCTKLGQAKRKVNCS